MIYIINENKIMSTIKLIYFYFKYKCKIIFNLNAGNLIKYK